MNDKIKLSASCVVFRDNKVLLVRHTYGAAKGKYVIPGGFSEIEELPAKTAEREVYEESKIKVIAKNIMAVRFTNKEVWFVYSAEYVSGEPESDLSENDSAIFMDTDVAIESTEVVETTKVIIKSLLSPHKNSLSKSDFVNSKFDKDEWQLYL